jgi:hypothetical protein
MAYAAEERLFRIGVLERLRAANFRCWVFVTEAWASSCGPGQSPRERLPIERDDRMDVVTFAAAEGATQQRMMASRQIYRASPGAPGRLMPLVVTTGPSEFVIDERARRAQA